MTTTANMSECGRKASADTRSMHAIARLVWDDLTPAQQEALRGSYAIAGGRRLASGTRLSTAIALRKRGLSTVASKWSPLSPAGMMVRDAGIKKDLSSG